MAHAAKIESDCQQVFGACASGRISRSILRTCLRDYISQLAWECLGILLKEMIEVAKERSIWSSRIREICSNNNLLL